MLVYYLSTFELGIYSVTLTIAAFIPLVLTSVNSIFFPYHISTTLTKQA